MSCFCFDDSEMPPCGECWKNMGVCVCTSDGQCLLCKEKPPPMPTEETIASLKEYIRGVAASFRATSDAEIAAWESEHGSACEGYDCSCRRCVVRRTNAEFGERMYAELELFRWCECWKAGDPRHRDASAWSDADVCSLAFAAAGPC